MYSTRRGWHEGRDRGQHEREQFPRAVASELDDSPHRPRSRSPVGTAPPPRWSKSPNSRLRYIVCTCGNWKYVSRWHSHCAACGRPWADLDHDDAVVAPCQPTQVAGGRAAECPPAAEPLSFIDELARIRQLLKVAGDAIGEDLLARLEIYIPTPVPPADVSEKELFDTVWQARSKAAALSEQLRRTS